MELSNTNKAVNKVTEFHKLKYHEQLKNFRSYLSYYDIEEFIKTKGFSINKKLHAQILFCYPDLINALVENNELDNSVSAIEAAKKSDDYTINKAVYNLSSDSLKNHDISMKVFNKEIDNDNIKTFMEQNNISSRRVHTYAKVYPSLYDTPLDTTDDFLFSKTLMAIEFNDDQFILENFDKLKKNNWIDVPTNHRVYNIRKFISVLNKLDKSQYTDDDLIKWHLNDWNTLHLAKHEDTVIKYWIQHNKATLVDSYAKLNACVLNNLEPQSISWDILKAYNSTIVTYFPYYFIEYLDNEELYNSVDKDSWNFMYVSAMKDPYNLHLVLENLLLPKSTRKDAFKAFIMNSNTNLYDSYTAVKEILDTYDTLDKEIMFKLTIDETFIPSLQYAHSLKCSREEKYLLLKKLLNDTMNEFSDVYTALSNYPVLALALDNNQKQKHVSSYIYNLMINLDKRMFRYI